MGKFNGKCLIVLASLFYLFVPNFLSAGLPTDQIRVTADKVLTMLQDPNLKSEAKKEERRNQLRQVIHARFDFVEMAKRSLGPHWQRRTAEEQREFVNSFADLLERSYVDKIESYNGEKVIYTNEVQDKNYAGVDTKIVTKKGEEFSVNYKLHLANGEWRVYDVVIENISLVNNYRSQFNRILSSSSYEELIRKLKAKQLEAPGRKA